MAGVDDPKVAWNAELRDGEVHVTILDGAAVVPASDAVHLAQFLELAANHAEDELLEWALRSWGKAGRVRLSR